MHQALQSLREATHVLVTVPPPRSPPHLDPVLLHHAPDLATGSDLQWAGYLSSTSVYGDKGGGWVDEDDLTEPVSAVGVARAVAERQWLDLHRDKGVPVHMFRLAGIYGPGRSALHTLVRRNGSLLAAGADDDSFISRVHVSDIVRVLWLSMLRPGPSRIFNVADDVPASRQEVMMHAAELLGIPAAELTASL
jgi:nucleoside-diphosphate-sugar epimerase